MTSKPWRVDVFLEKKIYNPGQKIVGTINFNLERKLNCDSINVQLFGSAKVFFTTAITKSGALSQNKAYEQELIFVDETKNVWKSKEKGGDNQLTWEEIARKASSTAIRLPQSNQNRPGLDVGSHEFSFEFDLPKSRLHTSFDVKGSVGYVRYYILVKCSSGNTMTLRRKTLFPVVSPHALLIEPGNTVVINEKVQTNKGPVLVTLNLQKAKFLPGEAVRGEITIVNNSSLSVKSALLYIKQDTTCYSTRPEIQYRESSYRTPAMGLPEHKITAGNSLTYPIKFNVSALIPNFDIPGCIQMIYKLCLDVGFTREHGRNYFAQIRVPIEIGTHFVEMGDAPPAYGDVVMSDQNSAPPDYLESICGLTEELDPDCNSYNPLCYHYNLGFENDDLKKTL